MPCSWGPIGQQKSYFHSCSSSASVSSSLHSLTGPLCASATPFASRLRLADSLSLSHLSRNFAIIAFCITDVFNPKESNYAEQKHRPAFRFLRACCGVPLPIL